MTNWSDLKTRLASALVMVVVGGAAIIAGGFWLVLLAALLAGLMIWELDRMTAPEARPGQAIAIASGAVLALATAARFAHPVWQLALVGPALALALSERQDRTLVSLYGFGAMVAVWGLVGLRGGESGLTAVLWLVLTIAASDMAGYFAGRHFGGLKFWPAISPKKTWSGTAAGWLAAALIGMLFWLFGFGGPGLVLVSPLLAFAGQMGDIFESWIKRREGVKDASALIPGHGGLLDRFDALLAATLVLVLLGAFGILPVQIWG
jgi:phosphatidate cytidylyltransferase